jgi:hypothetical protein
MAGSQAGADARAEAQGAAGFARRRSHDAGRLMMAPDRTGEGGGAAGEDLFAVLERRIAQQVGSRVKLSMKK